MRTIRSAAVLAALLWMFTPWAAATGGFSGNVLDATSGAPLHCEVTAITTDGDWMTSAQCDVGGHYQIDGLEAGDYLAYAEVSDSAEYFGMFYGGVIVMDEATSIQVADGQLTQDIDFAMVVGARVSGVIRSHLGGVPLAGIYVQVFNVPDWSYGAFASSEADGSYTVHGVPPGPVSVQAFDESEQYLVQYWDHQGSDDQAEVLELASGDQVSGVDFDLLLAGHITGRVVAAADGAPIAGAFVEAHDYDWTLNGSVTSEADGSFDVGNLAPATYRIYAEAEGYSTTYLLDEGGEWATIELAEGETFSGVEIAMAQGGAIAGRVLRSTDGSGVAGGFVAAWRPDDDAGGSAGTAADGSFVIDGLAAGRYMLYAEGAPGDNLVPRLYTTVGGNPILVEVVVGQTTVGVLMSLDLGGIITGTVTAAGDGRPLAGVNMEAMAIEAGLGSTGTSGADGSYTIVGVGSTDVLVSALHPDFVRQVYDGALFNDAGTPLRVAPGATLSGIDFSLAEAGAVTGRVLDALTGEPILGATVMAYFDQDLWLPGADATTGEEGRFTMGSVQPSKVFYVVAVDWQGRYAWQWYDGAIMFRDASPLLLLPGETVADVDFKLAEPGVITVSQTEFSFAGETYQEDIPPQLVSVVNLGPGPVALRVWTESDWLCLDFDWENLVLEAGDSLPVEISAWPWGLNAGSYDDVVHVVDDMTGAEILLSADLSLVDPPPRWEHDPGELWFDAEEGGSDPEPQGLYVANIGGGTVSFSVAAAPQWLEVHPQSGQLVRGDDATELSVQPVLTGLGEGEYSGTLSFNTSLGMRSSEVYLSVAPAPEGTPKIVAPDSLVIKLPGGASLAELKALAQTTFEIDNDGDGTLYWNAREANGWVELSPSSGVIPPGGDSVSVNLSVDPRGFTNGMSSTFIELGSSRDRAVIELGVQLGSDLDVEASVTAKGKAQLVVPVLVHAPGVNQSNFVSDLWISHRPSGRTIELTLYFVPEGADGTEEAVSTTLLLASGQTVSLLDVMENWLGGVIPKGALVIQGDEIDEVETSSRTYNASKNGSYGQSIPSVPTGDGLGRLEGKLHIPGLANSPDPAVGFRANLLITEVSGKQATARVTMLDDEGKVLGSTTRLVEPFSTTQVNRVFEAVGHTGAAYGARAEVEVAEGGGRVVTLGSSVDNITNDPTTLVGVRKNSSVDRTVVPVVAYAPGVEDTLWVSDVAVANVDSAPRSVRVDYFERNGSLRGSTTRELAAGHTWMLEDVVGTVFGQSSGRGSLIVSSEPVGGLAITSRTYNQSANGTYGQGVAGVPVAEVLGVGQEVVRLIALSSTEHYRTNLGLTEVLGEDARVGVVLRDAGGEEILGYLEVELSPHEQFQTNLFDAMGLIGSNIFAATAVVQVIEGDGGITVYASTVDNRTGDATTLPPPTRVSARDAGGLAP